MQKKTHLTLSFQQEIFVKFEKNTRILHVQKILFHVKKKSWIRVKA